MSRKENFDESSKKNKVKLIRVMKSGTYRINNHHKLIHAYQKDKTRPSLLLKLKQQSHFYQIWFSTFIILGITLLILDPTNWLNVFDLFIVMANIYLVVKRKVIGIYIGLLECIIYGIICWYNGLYGEVINAFLLYMPIYIYDIVNWTVSLRAQKKNPSSNNNDDELKINKLNKRQWFLYTLSTITIFILSYVLLKYIIKQEQALLFSALSIAVSIIGEIMIARCFMESYVLLYLGELIGLLIWVQSMLETTVTMEGITMIVYYLATFSNNLYGYYLWKDVYRKVAIKHGVLLNKRKLKIKKIIKIRRKFKNLHWNKEIDMNKNS